MSTDELTECFAIMGSDNSTPQKKQDAWDRIYWDKGIRDWIWGKARSFSKGSYHTAQDLSQEAWCHLGAVSSNYDPPRCPFGWYTVVVLNHFRNLTKNQERRWKRLKRYRKGTRSEDVLGDDPNLPPD
jgi:DNA-directed RNA polymerase specialized sigma24 family protein